MEHEILINSPIIRSLPLKEVYVGLANAERALDRDIQELLDLGVEMLLQNLKGDNSNRRRNYTSSWPTNSEVKKEIERRWPNARYRRGLFEYHWGSVPLRFHQDIVAQGLIAARPWDRSEKTIEALISGVEKVARGEDEFDKVVMRACRISNKSRHLAAEFYLLERVAAVDSRFKEHAQRISRVLHSTYFGFWLEALTKAADILHLEVKEQDLHTLCKHLTTTENGSTGGFASTGDESHFDAADGIPLLYDLFMKYFPTMMQVTRGKPMEQGANEEIRRARQP